MRLESVWSQSGVIPDDTLGFPLQGTAAKPSLAHWVAKGGLVQPRPVLLYVTLYVTRGPVLV